MEVEDWETDVWKEGTQMGNRGGANMPKDQVLTLLGADSMLNGVNLAWPLYSSVLRAPLKNDDGKGKGESKPIKEKIECFATLRVKKSKLEEEVAEVTLALQKEEGPSKGSFVETLFDGNQRDPTARDRAYASLKKCVPKLFMWCQLQYHHLLLKRSLLILLVHL